MEGLIIRSLVETDYEDILLDWWDQWGWTPPMKDFLPNNGTGGMIVFDGETPICAGFMYITNSHVAWVDWVVSNKEYRIKPNRRNAIKLLIESLTNLLSELKFKYVYALIKHDGLVGIYEELGYIQGDTYNKEMIKII